MAKNKTTKIVSKKHLARMERERRQTRAITYSAVGIVAIVLLLLAYGILNQTLLLGVKPAVIVNGEKVSMREFQTRMKVQRQQLIDVYLQYYQFAISIGIDPSTNESLAPTFQQIEQQLSPLNSADLGGQVIDTIIDELLVRQYAQANGITVTDADVQKSFYEGYNYFPNGTLTPTITLTPVVYSTLSRPQLTLVTATPTFTPTATATVGPTRTPSNLTPFPTLTPISQEGYDQQYEDSLKFFEKYGMSEADFRQFFAENRLYRDRVKALVTADVAREEEQVWARHILVADEATAEGIRAQLIDGADFATLAAENSLDTTNKDMGGDLGWFGRGKKPAEVENAAFALKVGEISQPIESTDGWRIIQVIGHEVRPLSATEYQAAVDAAFDAWLQTQRDAATIVIADNFVNYVPDNPTLQGAFDNIAATQTAAAPTNLSQQQTLQAQYETPTPSLTPTP